MRILAIETSCDETSVAIVDGGMHVLSNVIASSKAGFERFGGVIPEIAARRQVECMLPVLDGALTDAKITIDDIDAIAVTSGPGLLGSLLVGTTTARTLARLWKKPLVGVHHTLGHLSSTFLLPPDGTGDKGQGTTNEKSAVTCPMSHVTFPILALSVSGGHTDLWRRTSHLKGTLLGQTRDDAAGEAFDKGASMLGLPYPGGPSVAKAAEKGNREAFTFPHPLHKEDTLDFSYSGLKTALKYLLRDLKDEGQSAKAANTTSHLLADIAASYEHALCLHLADRIDRALKLHPDIREVHVVGGVSANTHLRWMLGQRLKHVRFRAPATLAYCTDNAAMIGAAAEFMIQELGDEAYKPFTTAASAPLTAAIHA